MGKLTALQVKNAKPKDKPYKLTDGDGLYLYVNKSGGRSWRYDYRFTGKRKTLTIGSMPEVSLADARRAHFEARQQVVDGKDPATIKKVNKTLSHQSAANTFFSVAEEWFEAKIADKSESYVVRTRRILEKDLYPSLGNRPIVDIKAPELLATLRKIESRTVDIAHRAKQTSGQVFRYAVATGRAEYDPSAMLTGVLKSAKTKHHATILDPTQIGLLMRNIDCFGGSFTVKTALQISPLLFQRPGEIRQMQWAHINWEQNRWEIPGDMMKMGNDHIVPLARQAKELLLSIQPYSGRFQYVFPSARGMSRCMSDNAVRTALRDIGYSNEQITPHGFRAMARTLLDENLKWRVDYIEQQLAHAVKDPTGRAYNRTQHLEQRTEMMQAWADYLDQLKG